MNATHSRRSSSGSERARIVVVVATNHRKFKTPCLETIERAPRLRHIGACRPFLRSSLFAQDVAGERKPLHTAAPEVRVYTVA